MEIIELDVGGTKFKTFKTTLMKSNYFRKLFNDKNYKKDKILFIDKNPLEFEYILNILRNDLPEGNEKSSDYSNLINYYEIDSCNNYNNYNNYNNDLNIIDNRRNNNKSSFNNIIDNNNNSLKTNLNINDVINILYYPISGLIKEIQGKGWIKNIITNDNDKNIYLRKCFRFDKTNCSNLMDVEYILENDVYNNLNNRDNLYLYLVKNKNYKIIVNTFPDIIDNTLYEKWLIDF